MGVLHLCFDGNFINNSLKVFEKYYPGQNLFIVNKEKKDFQMLQDDERLLGIPLEEEDFPKVHQLCIEHHIDYTWHKTKFCGLSSIFKETW